MEISRHAEIDKDLVRLKKFAAPKESLEAWERLFYLKGLKETPGIDIYPGFGQNKIYKARVVPLKENLGKSKGYRLIFQEIDNCVYKILAFSRHGIYDKEVELMNIIKNRLKIY